jgi:hypothetical protein
MRVTDEMVERCAEAIACGVGRAYTIKQDRIQAKLILDVAMPAYVELRIRLAAAEAKLESVREYCACDALKYLPILDILDEP